MSIVRIVTMMLGEMDFLSTFLQPLLDFRAIDVVSRQMIAATWFLIVFAVLMPILLMNLLIGLAVGDIETVRCNAQMKRLTMQVQMHSELERRLPKRFLVTIDKPEVFDYPNRSGPYSSQLVRQRLSRSFLGPNCNDEMIDFLIIINNCLIPNENQLSTVYNFFVHNKAAMVTNTMKQSSRRQQNSAITCELSQEVHKQRIR
jgi:hypothetical protein